MYTGKVHFALASGHWQRGFWHYPVYYYPLHTGKDDFLFASVHWVRRILITHGTLVNKILVLASVTYELTSDEWGVVEHDGRGDDTHDTQPVVDI